MWFLFFMILSMMKNFLIFKIKSMSPLLFHFSLFVIFIKNFKVYPIQFWSYYYRKPFTIFTGFKSSRFTLWVLFWNILVYHLKRLWKCKRKSLRNFFLNTFRISKHYAHQSSLLFKTKASLSHAWHLEKEINRVRSCCLRQKRFEYKGIYFPFYFIYKNAF